MMILHRDIRRRLLSTSRASPEQLLGYDQPGTNQVLLTSGLNDCVCWHGRHSEHRFC